MTAPQLPPGHVVAGKYSIQNPISAASGSTITYSAVTAQGQQVALKLFDMAIRQHAEAMARIERVFAAVNGLPPEGIVRVADAGYDPASGAPYSVTEVVAMPSLAMALQNGPMTPDAVSEMLRAIGATLDAAHGMQLVHGALKPTNVFVNPAQPGGAKVMDFGASVVLQALPTPEAQAASAPWLAPEQVHGAAAGPGADVFTLGLIAFFALTGRSYWRACQGAAPDLAAWQQELAAQRTAPSLRALELGVSLPGSIDQPLMIALAPDPGQRFRSAGELAQAFARGVANRDTAATAALPASAFLPPPGMEAAGAQPPQGPPQGGPPQGNSWSAPPPAGGMTPPPGAYGMDAMNAAPPASPQAAQQRSSSKLVPVLIALAALVLVVGSVAAWFFMTHGDTPEIGPVAVTVPTETQPAEPPPPVVEEDAGEPPPTDAEVTLSCNPACDTLTVDGQPFSSPSKLTAGDHAVVASKAGHTPQNETITVVAGTPLSREFTLTPVPKAPSNTGPSAPALPKEKCGKFLKRCKE